MNELFLDLWNKTVVGFPSSVACAVCLALALLGTSAVPSDSFASAYNSVPFLNEYPDHIGSSSLIHQASIDEVMSSESTDIDGLSEAQNAFIYCPTNHCIQSGNDIFYYYRIGQEFEAFPFHHPGQLTDWPSRGQVSLRHLIFRTKHTQGPGPTTTTKGINQR